MAKRTSKAASKAILDSIKDRIYEIEKQTGLVANYGPAQLEGREEAVVIAYGELRALVRRLDQIDSGSL